MYPMGKYIYTDKPINKNDCTHRRESADGPVAAASGVGRAEKTPCPPQEAHALIPEAVTLSPAEGTSGGIE